MGVQITHTVESRIDRNVQGKPMKMDEADITTTLARVRDIATGKKAGFFISFELSEKKVKKATVIDAVGGIYANKADRMAMVQSVMTSMDLTPAEVFAQALLIRSAQREV